MIDVKGLAEIRKTLYSYEVEELSCSFNEEYRVNLNRGSIWVNRGDKPHIVTGYNPIPEETLNKYGLILISSPL